MQQCSLMSSSQPLHAPIPATPAVKSTKKLTFFIPAADGSVAGTVIRLRAAVEPLSLSCGSVWKVNKSRMICFILWLCARVSLRSSLGARPRRWRSSSPAHGRIHRAGENAVLEAAGDDAAAAAAFVPSRRGMRGRWWWWWGWGQPTTHDETGKNALIGPETAVSQANGG